MTQRSSHLVVSGYYGRGNLGDEAILHAIINGVRELAPTARLTVISAAPRQTRAQHGVEAISHRDLLGIARAIHRSNGLISGGGSLLQDQTSQRPVPYYGGIILLARLLGRPILVFAQGIGPLRRSHQRWLAALALRAATYVSVRDARSLALLRELGVTRSASIVPDPVLSLAASQHAPRPTGADPEGGSRPQGHPRLVVSLRSWVGSDRWVPEVVAALRQLSDHFEVILMPLHLPEDIVIASEVEQHVGGKAHVVIPADFRHAIREIVKADVVVGMRLHSLVFAALSGRPFVAISYDPKVRAFSEQLSQPVIADFAALVGSHFSTIVEQHYSADHRSYELAARSLRSQAALSGAETLARVATVTGPSSDR